MATADDPGVTLPRVSILMLTYNHAKLIEQAIEGVLSQKTTFAFKLLLCDDCSTDGTREICMRYAKSHPAHIVLQLPERNRGAQPNAIQIYNSSHGEFVAVCEGDDYWTHPEKLQRQVEAMDAHPNWSGCFHKTRVCYDDPAARDSFLPDFESPREVGLEQIAAENCIATCSVMYRRKLVPKLPDLFSALALCDWPLNILYASHGPFGYLSEEMAVYRRHSGGSWSTLKQAVRLDHTLRALFAVESATDEPIRSKIIQGRREFLQRVYIDDYERLKKIETRYRGLQLHRIAAIGKWVKEMIGR